MTRVFLAFFATILLLRADDPARVIVLVKDHCVQCHNETVRSGKLDLTRLISKPSTTFADDRSEWEKVLEKLQTGQMPPPPLPQAPPAVVSAAKDWLKEEFARQDGLIHPEAGRVAAHRLNRAEYDNTIRDLLGVDIRPADRFPADTAAYGFDNISDALGFSPALLEHYLNAAERAVKTALFGPERRKPAMVHYPAPVRLNLARGTSSLPADLFHYDTTGLSTLHSFHVMHRFPVDAEYSFPAHVERPSPQPVRACSPRPVLGRPVGTGV